MEKLLVKLKNNLRVGDFVVNVNSDFIWQIDNAESLDVVNKGVDNGKTNVCAVICFECSKHLARYKSPTSEKYFCKKCYLKLLKQTGMVNKSYINIIKKISN